MRRTPLGALVAGIGWTGLAVGLWIGTLAPALVGLWLLAWTEGARWRLRGLPLHAERDMPQEAHLGQQFPVTTTVVADEDVVLRVQDEPPAALGSANVEAATTRRRAQQRMQVEASTPGTHRWRQCHVDIEDPWGLHATRRAVPAVSTLRVHAEPDWAAAGRRTGARHTVQTLAPSRRAYEADPSIETVRPYQPGDRLRDIDWPRSTRMGTLFTKQRTRVAPRPVVVVLDAGATMRLQHREAKLTTAVRFMEAVAAAAAGAGTQAGLLAVGEGGCQWTRPGASGASGASAVAALARALADLPAPYPSIRLPDSGQGNAAAAYSDAVGRLLADLSSPAFVVAVLDGELHPVAATVLVQRLVRRGHEVVLVVPATGAHHVARRGIDRNGLERLRAWHRERRQLAKVLGPLGVPVLSLHSRNVAAVVEEVARCAR